MEHYRRVVLCIDVMKVNKIPFLVTISRAIKFGTVAWLKNSKIETIMSSVTQVRNVYLKRGFTLEVIEADGQFEPLRGELGALGITLNKCSRQEHVPVAERRIRTLKERCRCIHNMLPFKKLPAMLVIQMVSTCNFWLNIYPPTDGVSRSINPRELLTGVKIDYNKHIRAEFGEYVQVHEEHNNSMQPRTTGAIATKPTGNSQGGHWFYSLTTGRMLDQQKWTPLPMPAEVIERMNTLAKTGQAGLHFTNRHNEAYSDTHDAEPVNNDDESVNNDEFDSDSNESESDSDSDSDYNDDSSDSTDDDLENFIAGVNGTANVNGYDNGDEDVNGYDNDNDDHEDPNEPSEDDDEDINGTLDNEDDDADNEDDDTDTDEEPVIPSVVPTILKRLTDNTGALPPVIQSRTRQQSHEAGENLLIRVNTVEEPVVKTITKKQ